MIDLTTFFPIFSTVSTESVNPKNGISIHCNYVKLEELIYDFANNTGHQLFKNTWSCTVIKGIS